VYTSVSNESTFLLEESVVKVPNYEGGKAFESPQAARIKSFHRLTSSAV